ncbi:MAG: diaminopimelate epimerase [Planctomycetes bacterium]|nr:diaminopimelate epimerase [Planctomycetota bacterium]
MRFTKMHGLGNDYVYVNGFEEKVARPEKVAVAVSDRHFGIGADGLILILPSKTADVRMRMFNADGSESEMCGNGIRCVAKYAYDHGLLKSKAVREIAVETGAGVKTLHLTVQGGKVSKVRVNIGQPRLLRQEIPMLGPNGQVVGEPFTVDGQPMRITCVSMGNPHCIIFVDEMPGLKGGLKAVPLATLGPKIENHPSFPKRINVHFVEVASRREVRMATWERGSGITLACGTGASAVCVASALNDRTGRRITAHLPGGPLEMEWAKDGNVYMTGPAVEVFEGEWT